MNSKLFSLVLAVLFTGTLFAQNAPSGGVNYYEDLYGTVSPATRGDMDALVFIDYAVEDNFVVAALNNLGYTVTVASSWSDFNTKIATGSYGMVVGFTQGNPSGVSPTVVQDYIDNGGCMIYCDWYRDGTVAGIFEASYTGGTNESPMTISDPVLASGLTNPVVLTNPGWNTWSMSMNPIGSGEVLATFPSGAAAVVRGNGGNTILLGYLGDTPPYAERQQLFENVVKSTTCGGYEKVPVSNWALFLGLFLIVTFAVVRFVKTT